MRSQWNDATLSRIITVENFAFRCLVRNQKLALVVRSLLAAYASFNWAGANAKTGTMATAIANCAVNRASLYELTVTHPMSSRACSMLVRVLPERHHEAV